MNDINDIENMRKSIGELSAQMNNFIKQADSDEKKLYNDFAYQLGEWSATGALPSAGNQDTKYYLELKRKKYESRGITTSEILKPRNSLPRVTGTTYKDRKYTNRRLFKSFRKETTYFKNGRKKLKTGENVILYEMITSVNEGQIGADEPYCCPYCGAVTTVGELQNGCPFCGSRFIMQDLFPKVTNFFYLEDSGYSSGEMKIKALKFTAVGFLAGVAAAVFQMCNGKPVEAYLSLPIAFAIGGLILLPFSLLGKLILESIMVTPILFKTGGTKRRLTDIMRRFDPNFSYEFFESRVLSLLKIMLYCDDKDDLAVYVGNSPAPKFDVIDAVYRGAIALKDFRVEGGYFHIVLDVYMDCVHDLGEKLRRRNSVYRIGICKNTSKPTDLGFSFKKVTCGVCGASFDATKAKHCPFCGGNYELVNDDWVVTEIRQVN